jgi:arginase
MLKIIPACTSLGSVNKGTEKAPLALLDVSLQTGLHYNKIPFKTLPKVTDNLALADKTAQRLHNYNAVIDFNERLYTQIIQNVKSDDIALTLGGDHSVGMGSLFATKKLHKDACVVYIDAHPDCVGPEETLTGNLHGMQLTTILGDGLYNEFSLPTYNYSEIFVIGVKDIDQPEYDYMDKHKICYYTMDHIIREGIAKVLDEVVQKIAGRPVHVSYDSDSLDVSEAPATGIINKGGLSYREASYLCRNLARQNIVAVDMVEVNPTTDVENKTVMLASELIISLLGGQWSVYDQYLQTHSI